MFVSYRRSDAQSAARQLAEALTERFSAENVFFDTESLDMGSPWRSSIGDRVGSADAVLAVIGPRWVAIADARGRRQILDPARGGRAPVRDRDRAARPIRS